MGQMINFSHWVIVFDIDDTLISEYDYQISGVRAIENLLSEILNKKFNGKFLKYIDQSNNDFLSEICNEIDFPNEFKESLLWTYRLHYPDIKLYSGIEELISSLKFHKANLAILSDGRSISQRLKLKALGLGNIPSFISEEFMSDKFSKDRFIKIQNRWPKKKYLYIGDNPKKDFIIPKKLGWFSIGADWVPNKVHKIKPTEKIISPDVWFKKPNDVITFLTDKNNNCIN